MGLLLPLPRTPDGRAGLEAVLADPVGALLGCDYDGTLAPIVADPAQAWPQPGAVPALVDLADRLGHVAVVSGRPAASVVQVGGLAAVPGLVVYGLYGAERWAGGALHASVRPVELDAVLPSLSGLVETLAPGSRIEDKGAALAVHVRGSSQPQHDLAVLRPALEALARRHGLVLEAGRLVLELRPPGADKGRTLDRHVTEVAARSVLFVGDDLGDLAAFETVERLRGRGVAGLTVASASAETPEVAERADLVVDGPAGVVELLRSLAQALAGAD